LKLVTDFIGKVVTMMSELKVSTTEKGQAKLNLSRGGRREGSGRKKKEGMETRKVSISLPAGWWEYIDMLKERSGGDLSQSDILRNALIPVLVACQDKNGLSPKTDFIKSDSATYNMLSEYFNGV
jgi:hypothetical protein